MAIIQGLPGVEVTIQTDGWTAWEYDDPAGADDETQHPRVITKFIECSDDEPFEIHLKASGSYSWGYRSHALKFTANIDGVWATAMACKHEHTFPGGWERYLSRRVVGDPYGGSRYVSQKFAFSKITKVDWATNEKYRSDVQLMKQIGTIEVEVYRVTFEGEAAGHDFTVEDGDPFLISREAMKGKTHSHGTKFIGTQPTTAPRCTEWTPLREDNGPIAIFRFKYRSREALKREGITPYSDSESDGSAGFSDDEKYDDDQQKAKLNWIIARGLKESHNAVKEEEKDEKESDDDVVFLREVSRTGSKCSRNGGQQDHANDKSNNDDVTGVDVYHRVRQQLQELLAELNQISEGTKENSLASMPPLPRTSPIPGSPPLLGSSPLPRMTLSPGRIPVSSMFPSPYIPWLNDGRDSSPEPPRSVCRKHNQRKTAKRKISEVGDSTTKKSRALHGSKKRKLKMGKRSSTCSSD